MNQVRDDKVEKRLLDAPLLKKLSLRDYQREAIRSCLLYIGSFRQLETNRAGLVHMATGTGKTGVIASLARCIPEIGTTMVLAPRVALCDQLEIELASRFFEKLQRRPKPGEIPKRVVSMEQLIERGAKTRLSNLVVVSTIQMFESMSRTASPSSKREKIKRQLCERLIAETDLVLVDEGHYEPALSWSQALRQIRAPRILFTATPYRNDLKAFDVDLRFSFHFTLKQATTQHFIREIRPIARAPLRDPREFVEDVLQFYDEEVHVHWPQARVIIRCDNVTSIGHMAQVMQEKKRPFVPIHDQFDDVGGEDWERRTVPRRDAADQERCMARMARVFGYISSSCSRALTTSAFGWLPSSNHWEMRARLSSKLEGSSAIRTTRIRQGRSCLTTAPDTIRKSGRPCTSTTVILRR